MNGLRDEEWDSIRDVGRLVRFASGSSLGNEGEQNQSVFALQQGDVSIVLAGEDGSEYLVGMRRAGDLVGEMAAIDGLPRSASMVAKGSVVAWKLTGLQFEQFLAAHPAASIRIMQAMARRLRQAAAMHVLRGEVLHSRVAATLVSLSADTGSLTLELTQQELANWVGATREATGRVLADFRSQHLIVTQRGGLQILDLDGLAAT